MLSVEDHEKHQNPMLELSDEQIQQVSGGGEAEDILRFIKRVIEEINDLAYKRPQL